MGNNIVSNISSAIAAKMLDNTLAAGGRISIPSLYVELYIGKDGVVHTVCLVCNGVDVLCTCRPRT